MFLRRLSQAKPRLLATEASNISSFIPRSHIIPKSPLATSIASKTDAVEGFSLLKSKTVPELQVKASHFRHTKTGAELFHFDKDDSNCVFAVGFKTPVLNSNGLPHVLEHTTLCGSEKYPVRDPFFKMLNRSLATYMNAWTASDYTLYLFASQNKDDYFNLMDVYLDAVFCPKLDFHDFAQEGWRLEHADPKDPSSPIVFKGVVFSEMKGAMSDISSLFHAYLQDQLMKGSIYAHNSGGDPKDIVHLTWPELRSFHQKYYHPANAKFFTYGNLDLNLVFIKVNQMLNKLQRPNMKPDYLNLPELSELKEPITIHRSCSFDPMGDPEKQVRACFSFLTNDSRDAFTSFALRVLSQLLLDGSSSPMQRALIDSGFAPDYSPSIGYDNSIRQTSFSIGVQGIHKDHLEQLQEIIWKVLNECVDTGFPKETVEAVLQQMELGLKHITAHFGLGLIQSVSSGQFHGVDLFESLNIDSFFQRIRKEVDQGLFQKLIQTYFLSNPRRVFLVVQPDPEFPEEQEQVLSKELDKHLQKLTDVEKERIYESGLALLEKQKSPQDLSVLPCLSLDQVSPLMKKYPWIVHDLPDGYSIFSRAASTNGVSYLRAFTKLDLPEHLLPYLPLFCGALTWMGTHRKSMAELDQEIKASTGGIAAYPMILRNPSSLHKFEIAVGISGNAMSHYFTRLSSLMQELLFETNFNDQGRLVNLISRNFQSMVNSIPDSGHRYGHSLAASMVHNSSRVSEMWNGLSQIQFLHQIQTSPIEKTIEALQSISKSFSKMKTKFIFISPETNLSSCLSNIHSFATKYPTNASDSFVSSVNSFSSFQPKPRQVFVPIPSPVHYCAMATSTVPYVDTHSLPLQLLSHILMFRSLHSEIREQGGAYGAHASLDALSGTFGFTSYRDPHHSTTFRNFLKACQLPLTSSALMEAKLSWIGQMDRPLDVSDQGLAEVYGLAPELQQRRRDQLKSIKIELLNEARQFWLPSSSLSSSSLSSSSSDPSSSSDLHVLNSVIPSESDGFARVLLGPSSLISQYEKAGWTIHSLDFI